MHQGWHRIVSKVNTELPDLNDDLLLDFRPNKIEQIKPYIDAVFKSALSVLKHPGFVYKGYTVLSPEERLESIINNPIFKGSIEIQRSTFETMKIGFEFETTPYYVYINVPYMDNHCVTLSGTEYYPLFPIVERGGLHCSDNKITIKVMRAPLSYWRRENGVFVVDGTKPRSEIVVTAKIHQRTRRGKLTEKTPLLIYMLAKFGFKATMAMFKFAEGEISFIAIPPGGTVPKTEGSKPYSYIKVTEQIYIRVLPQTLDEIHKRRVIASLMCIFANNKKFTINDILRPTAEYFKVCLGRYTYPAGQNDELLFRNAEEHLEMTDTLLDSIAQHQLRSIGVDVKDIYELCHWVMYNIDQKLISYKPTNLYDKKIGALDQIMAGLVRDIFNKLFDVINNSHQKKVGLTHQTINKFVRSSSKFNGSWFSSSRIFRPEHAIHNSNWLLTIGGKRILSLDNAETARGGATGHNCVPKALLKAHPSQLVVTSILSIPSSSPCVAGDINPFLIIDKDGNIEEPVWAGEIADAFD